MAKTKSKKSPAFLFIVFFIVIIAIMFIANQNKTDEVVLKMPFNEGIRSLSTFGNKLLAVASDGKIFFWDWTGLDQNVITGKTAFEQALLLDNDSVISVRQGYSCAVVISSAGGENIEKEIRLGSGANRGVVTANRDRSVIVAILAVSSNSKPSTDYKFYNINVEMESASKMALVSDNSSLIQLADFAVSDDGRFLAAAGAQDHKARMVLVDIEQKRIIWGKIYESPDSFGSAVFSFDGKTIYAGGGDRVVYYINAADGEVVDQFDFQIEASAAHETSSIRSITISPDGSMMAYTHGFLVYVFDHKNKTEIHSQYPGHKLAGPVAFSPDSTQLATSSLRQGGVIRILPIPEH